jgi:hypothetical protein
MKYASLIGPLLGLYYPLPFESEAKNRAALASSGLKHLWCSIYDKAEVEKQVARFGGGMLPDGFARKLDYRTEAVEKVK